MSKSEAVDDSKENIELEETKTNEEETKTNEEENEEPEEELKFAEVDTEQISKDLKLNDEPVIIDKKIEGDLYAEFNTFLEKKADIKEDVGTKMVIPTGIRVLDSMLGGGFAVGAFHIICGTPGSGKSMLSMQTMAGGQQKYKNMIASFLDSEEATSTLRLANLGVRNPKVKPYTDITIEKVFRFIETMCLFKEQRKMMDKPSLIIWDSIANTLSEREREIDDINSVIGYKARLLSLVLPKYIAKMAKYNICTISVNQLRDQIGIGNFGPAKTLRFMSAGKSMPGGNIIQYNAFQLLEMKAKAVLDPSKFGFDGIMSSITSVKNKIFSPNITIRLIGNFLTGFSDFWTSYNFLVENKRIQTGAWNLLKTHPNIKFRTKDAENKYNTDNEFKKIFDEAIEECIKVEIIEKNTIQD